VTRVDIVFHSITGTTAELAAAVQRGAAGVPGVEARKLEIVGADIAAGRYDKPALLDALDAADAIIFGSPTYMGGVTAQLKAFIDASSEKWQSQRWADKLAAGFTVGANLSGDQLSALQYLQTFACQHGMLWVGLDLPGNADTPNGNLLGAQSGLIAHATGGELAGEYRQTAAYLGRRVATLATRFALPRQGAGQRGGDGAQGFADRID